MPRIHVVHPDPIAPFGRLAEALPAAGADVVAHHIHAGEPLPPVDVPGVVLLGGRQNVYADAEHPNMAALRDFTAQLVAAGTPVLGICLGSQLLGTVGGEVTVSAPAGPELGYALVTATAAGLADPVLGPAFAAAGGAQMWQPEWHSDAVTKLPPGAVLLATSDKYVQAFRLGSAVAVQFHPEATPDDVQRWVELTGMGDAEAFAARAVQVDAAVEAACTAMCRAWLAGIEQAAESRPVTAADR